MRTILFPFLRLREVKQLVQGHTDCKWGSTTLQFPQLPEENLQYMEVSLVETK